MPNYVRGEVLGTATALPITAAGLLLAHNHAHYLVVAALLMLNLIVILLTASNLVRFMINNKRE